MQSNVLALRGFNMDFDRLRGQMASRLNPHRLSGDFVIRRTGWHTLREFAAVVGNHLPLRTFGVGAADFYFDAVDGLIVRSPDCSQDQGVIFRRVMARAVNWGQEFSR